MNYKKPPTILITGCSSGIGLECAKQLHDKGWLVNTTARNNEDIDMLKEIGVFSTFMDYAVPRSIHQAFTDVMKNCNGKLDAVFHNGAYGQPGAIEDLKPDVLRDQFEVNFFGWHELTCHCLPVMRQQGHGRIIFCSSILGLIPAPFRGAYNASKYAIEGYASTLRLELHDTDIKVSLIEPGPVKTRFSDNALEKFLANIDIENSSYHENYHNELKRLKHLHTSDIGRFRVHPKSVYDKLEHALLSKNPRAHYGVTVPTHFMNVVRRILPQSMIDWIILRNA